MGKHCLVSLDMPKLAQNRAANQDDRCADRITLHWCTEVLLEETVATLLIDCICFETHTESSLQKVICCTILTLLNSKRPRERKKTTMQQSL